MIDSVAQRATTVLSDTGARTEHALRPGQTLEARVEARLGNGAARLSSGGTVFEAQLPASVRVGTSVLGLLSRSGPNLTFTPLTTAAPVSGVPSAVPAEIAALLQSAAAAQDSAAPLLATLEAVTADAGKPLPVGARQAIEQLLGLRLPAGSGLAGEALRDAVMNSGIFLEAKLAQGAAPAAIGTDMKALLLLLQNALRGAPGTGEAARPGTLKSSPPPRRGGLPQSPGTGLPLDLANLSAAEIEQALLAQTGAALARLRLSQAASMPDDGEARRDRPAAEWTFEVPFIVDGKTMMVQFLLERDGVADGDRGAAEWRLRFSLDAGQPIGPVHALVALSHGALSVTLWAETDTGARLLRRQAAQLDQTLQNADLNISLVAIHNGRPPSRDEPSGAFVDQQT
jgi:hypothetical protein